MKTLNIAKARQRIRLDDSPGSPEFVLDLTDDSLNAMALPIAGSYAVFTSLLEEANRAEGGDPEGRERLAERVSSLFRVCIDTLLGAGAHDAIVAYVTDGEDIPATQLTHILSPVVGYLFERFGAAIGANVEDATARYLGDDDGADAL